MVKVSVRLVDRVDEVRGSWLDNEVKEWLGVVAHEKPKLTGSYR